MNPLPSYRVRESARAQRVRFCMTPRDGFVVVVPIGFDRARIPGLIREKADWVQRAAEKLDAYRSRHEQDEHRMQPRRIHLQGVDGTWTLEYEPSRRASVRVLEQGRHLTVHGALPDTVDAHAALRRWLVAKGRRHLLPLVENEARGRPFTYRKASVRCQRTRWGSCSQAGRLSLNAQLLFLPRELIRYVVLHELCHTVHLDHSEAFWTLLGTFDDDVDQHRREIRTGWLHVPPWAVATPTRPHVGPLG